MTLTFQYPQLLILLLLLPLCHRYLTDRRLGVSTVARLAVACLLVVALSRPRIERPAVGTDLIVLADRSASCGGDVDRMLREILPIIRTQSRAGARLAVVGFGDGAAVERGFAGDVAGLALPDNFEMASDLAEGVRLAGGLRDPARRTAVLCLTDGLYTGESPVAAPVLTALGGAPFWYRRLGGGGGLEVAAGAIALPDLVQPNSAWPVRFTIHANAPTGARFTLTRNGAVVARDAAELRRGDNHFFIRDSAPDGELLEYRLEVSADGDGKPQNNAASALVRVGGAPRVLVVSDHRNPGLLTGSLTAAAIPVDGTAPELFPEAPALLTPYKLIVLENCQLSSFPSKGVRALAETVRSGAASLLVTGGPNSFGMGGYHRSKLDSLLPIEMELRNDTRRGSMAVAMALDRSGSMAVPAERGMTKMDLANLGAAESIRLLSDQDQVAVIAVDSAAHIVVPLSVADVTEKLVDLTLGIQSMGGGIFCRTAIEAAAAEIEKSNLRSRHIILFADASDAEEQDGCFDLARSLLSKGVSLSVVAMGEPSDVDAAFLIELARVGGGEALFSSEASGLPALFTQEIMRVSRRGFLEEPVTPALLSPMALLGVTEPAAPRLGGYNVAAGREGAVVYMRLNDEFLSPLAATRTLGRSGTGALLFEVDGEFSGDFPGWAGAPEMLVALARRLAPGMAPVGIKAYSGLERGVAEVTLEFSPEAASQARAAGELRARWLGPGGTALESGFEWLRSDTARSTVRLNAPGHYLPLVDIPGVGLVTAPAVSLPYSLEFAAGDAVDGLAVLRELATLTGGGDGLDLPEVRESARATRLQGCEIAPLLIVAAILLFLLELSIRRRLWLK